MKGLLYGIFSYSCSNFITNNKNFRKTLKNNT